MSGRDPFRLVGTVIAGKYRVDRVVGEGGLGVVYAGHHLQLDQPVAIKLLKPLGGTPEDEQRRTHLFLREARVLFSLTHPNIVRLFDAGELAQPVSVPYVVLELIDGPTLDDEIQRRSKANAPFTLPELTAIFEPVLEAVAFAHQNGVAHRDLKPSNVMLVRNQGAVTAKVVDFGIARRVNEQRQQSVSVTGFTPRYAAPEQWDASLGPSGPQTDVFALGLMLAETCTLQPVFSSAGAAEIFMQVMSPSRRVSVGSRRPDLPPELDRVIERATKLKPQDRFPSGREMLLELRNALRARSAEQPIAHAAISATSEYPLSRAPTAHATPVQAVSPMTPLTPPAAAFPSAPPAGAFPSAPPTPHPSPSAQAPTAPYPAPVPRSSGNPIVLVLVIALIAVIGLSGAVVWLALDRERRGPAAQRPQDGTSQQGTGDESPSRKKIGKYSVTLENILGAGTGLTEGQVTKVIQAHLGELKECWRKAIERTPDIDGGTVTLMIDVGADGKSGTTMAAQDGIGDAPFRQCLTAASSDWKYPKPNAEWGSADFMATFRFKRDR